MNDINKLQKLVEKYPPKRSTSNVRIAHPDEYDILVKLTNFLKDESPTSQRLWHIRNDMLSIPICKLDGCNNQVKWQPPYCDYANYCSPACSTRRDKNLTKEKKHLNNIQKYGEGYEKLSKYEKYKITNIKLYGVENPFKDVEFIKKCNRKKYGSDFHFQQHIEEDSIKKLNDKDWLYDMNHNKNKSCVEIADILGVNNTTVNKALYRNGITPNHIYTGSFNEAQLLNELTKLNLTIEANNRTIISPYELDIVFPDKKVAIEYCGLYWHNEKNKPNDYHKTKYDLCKKAGYRLLTIFEDEWLDNKELVLDKIKHILNCSTKKTVPARKCTVKCVNKKDKSEFYKETHIQGNSPSTLTIGLYYDNELVSCMSFVSNSIMRSAQQDYNLVRFSTKYIVPGAFSKLLKFFIKNTPDINSVITFADLRWGDGELYEKCGFIVDAHIPPDYYYIKDNRRRHKFNFRHSKLKSKLENYDDNKSEHENCSANNIFRIFDCGKIRYRLSNI